MRKLCTVAVLVLMFMMSILGQVNASVRPMFDSPNRGTDTDDHPWGGDQGGGGASITPINRPIVTGFFAVDFFFNRVVVTQMHFHARSKQSTVTPSTGTVTPATTTQTRGTSAN